MASFTFSSVGDLFGVGTSVGAYLPNRIPGASSPVTGAAVTTAVVAADGSLAFSGLLDDTAYVAYDSGSGRSRRFRSPPVAASGSTVRDFENQVLLGLAGGGSDTYLGDPIGLGTRGGTVTTTVRSDQPFTVEVHDSADKAAWQILDSKVATLRGSLYVATLVASTVQPWARIKVQNTSASPQTSHQALRQVVQ